MKILYTKLLAIILLCIIASFLLNRQTKYVEVEYKVDSIKIKNTNYPTHDTVIDKSFINDISYPTINDSNIVLSIQCLTNLNLNKNLEIVKTIDKHVVERLNKLEELGLIKDGVLQDPIIEGELKKEIETALNKNIIENNSNIITTDITDWSVGIASAYGGYGDAQIRDNQITATGDAVTESSMGVAIPMAWSNFRSYYGKTVIIQYNGITVKATINDCGGMANGARHLDLQPGVFKLFGYDNCNDWGLREVKYKILN